MTTANINSIADRIQRQKKATNDDLVIVVSAMGKATDKLIALAHELSPEPVLREMDNLLNTGEMVSMSLLSISLNEKGCPAIGLCGHQAGILTDQFYSNASISEIDPKRLKAALRDGNVVVVAGFQGQNSQGDLTTLGRGGSDTTAIAIAASLQADRCEILKDVPAIFSADPRIVPEAYPLKELGYDQLLDMTFWGAKVLQYRSVEIAKYFKIPLYVGSAHSYEEGTHIQESNKMIESTEILSLNSHETVLKIATQKATLKQALSWFRTVLEAKKIPYPQMLHSESVGGVIELYITAPREAIAAMASLKSEAQIEEMCSVTATCRSSTRPEIMQMVVDSLEEKGMKIKSMLVSAMSMTVFLEKTLRESAIQMLHKLIPTPRLQPKMLPVRVRKI